MSQFMDLFRSRIRAVAPPNRPLRLSQIGKMVDEHRKIAIVTDVIDATHWRGTWRGQNYECRQFPDTLNLSDGDAVVVHAIPGTTELFSTYMVEGVPELYWIIGATYDSGTNQGELWRLKDTVGAIPELVWTAPNDQEYLTHICWSKVSNKLTLFTALDTALDFTVRVYEWNQTTELATLKVTETSLWADWPNMVDSVIGTAQWQNQIYCICGATTGQTRSVWRYDGVDFLFDYRFADEPHGHGGGIATDSGNTVLYVHDGNYLKSNDGIGGYVADADLTAAFDTWDSLSMVTDWNADKVYMGQNPAPPLAFTSIAVRDTATGITSASLSDAGLAVTPGVQSLTNQYNEATGAWQAVWAIAWGWWYNDVNTGELWYLDAGGVWQLDGSIGGLTTYTPRSLAWFNAKLHILAYDRDNTSPDWWIPCLYRRDAAGSYTLVKKWPEARSFFTFGGNVTSSMVRCPAPGAGAAALALQRRCHEV